MRPIREAVLAHGGHGQPVVLDEVVSWHPDSEGAGYVGLYSVCALESGLIGTVSADH